TREQLRALAADLPMAQEPPAQPDIVLNLHLLCLLFCVCPPAGAVYWLLTRRNRRPAVPRTNPWPSR
ncbi:MAG: hypothetical protein ACRDRL_12080, partial [Sciscionella sp.]